MKIIVGAADSGKSTILMHFVYNEIAKLLAAPGDPNKIKIESATKDAQKTKTPHAVIITSKRRMAEKQMIFGIYCEVSIETLREIKLKYIEDYQSLIQFLADFHLI